LFFLGIPVLIVVLALLLIFPATRAFLVTHKRMTVLAVVIFLAFTIAQPYVSGMRGLMGERGFESHLRAGMSRDEAEHWATKFGSAPNFITSWQMHHPYSPLNDGRLDVFFEDWVTTCLSHSRRYVLHFSPEWKLKKWHVESWDNDC
jgi:hypothetical protein